MNLSIQRVKRPLALGEQVYHALRTLLRSGQIALGQPLQEVQLAEHLGVSRTPVRQAMTRLASEGLLASAGRGFVVPRLTLRDVDDIYEVRF
ncbi:MAG: GntR family transcriptional regulator, partial [Comamonadaceae bacterium]|nr:GntR family transcriptional regulator [Comamonadaceae bacterium]